jgi:hypothetical protein
MSLVRIFNSADGETGTIQSRAGNRYQREGRTAMVQAEIASGDTVLFEGRMESTLTFVTLDTFTANEIAFIDLPAQYRCRRTVDGGNDSTVWVEDFA